MRSNANKAGIVSGNNPCDVGAVAIAVSHGIVIGAATVITDKVCTICDLTTGAKATSQSWVLHGHGRIEQNIKEGEMIEFHAGVRQKRVTCMQ